MHSTAPEIGSHGDLRVQHISSTTALVAVEPREAGHTAAVGVGTLADGVWLLLADADSARRLAEAALQAAAALDRVARALTPTQQRTAERADAMEQLAKRLRANGEHSQAAEYEAAVADMRAFLQGVAL